MKPCRPPASCTRLLSWSALVALAATELSAQSSADAVSATRGAVEKWVDTRDLITKETRDWALQKEALAARSDIVKRDIVALQKRIAEAESNLAEADKKRLELVADSDKRKASVASLEQRIVALEERARKLLPRLPDPLRERVALLSQRLPKAGEATKLQLSDRFANVIGVLNELHKWNREITVTSELRQLPDGQSVEVAVLYIGLGQAFYTGGNGKVGGVGTATAEGWVWRPANEWAAEIQRTIAIWKNEQVAAFVHLPIKVM
jgi:chromosome segregation ATPase